MLKVEKRWEIKIVAGHVSCFLPFNVNHFTSYAYPTGI
jgi:hypothetical protein